MQRPSLTPERLMQPVENFQSFYNTTLRPKLKEIDAQRQAIVDKIKLYGAVGIGGGLVESAAYDPGRPDEYQQSSDSG